MRCTYTMFFCAICAAGVASPITLRGINMVQAQESANPRELDVPYVPTPQTIVDKMLELAAVKADDTVIDLGSGDGRIPITAAKRFGARAIGIDLNPIRVEEAQANAKKSGVENKVQFKEQNLFETDISQATVLTMYLLPKVNLQLRPKIISQLKPGTRVVSHSFDMGDWPAEKTEKVDGRTIYFWTVPDCANGKARSPICNDRRQGTKLR
jgi:SAM-dependent methyltransferase